MGIKLFRFKNALNTLKDAFVELKQNPNSKLMRDGVIQRFEYNYEIAWKLIKRYLEVEMGDTSIDTFNKKDLYRKAAVAGLIDNPEDWFYYHECRNLTSHTYEENIAEKVFEASKGFLISASQLLNEFEKRLEKK